MRKERIKEILDELPDEVDLKDLFYRLQLFEHIDIAEKQIAEGDVYSHEEVKQMLKELL